MEADSERRFEGTNHEFANWLVSIGNIYQDAKPDAPEGQRLKVQLYLHDRATKVERRETVSAGSVITIAAERYCVAELHERRSDSEPGGIVLRRLVQK